MVNYSNGKIYKIVCNVTGKQYVGSTTKKYLSQRLQAHVGCYKQFQNGNTKKTMTSFQVLKEDDYANLKMSFLRENDISLILWNVLI